MGKMKMWFRNQNLDRENKTDLSKDHVTDKQWALLPEFKNVNLGLV